MRDQLSAANEQDKPTGRLLDEKLFKARALTVFGEINDRLARNITERLLALAAESSAAFDRGNSTSGYSTGSSIP